MARGSHSGEEQALRDDVGTTSPVPAADRVLTVLDALADHRHPMLASTIAFECGVPRSTIYRLLAVMGERGYAVKSQVDHTWTVGPRLVAVGRGAPTIRQALQVLEAFDAGTPNLTVSALAARAAIDVAAASHIVRVLLEEGLVTSDGAGRLSLGPRLVSLASRAVSTEALVRAARPLLEQLRDRTRETANLVVRDGANAVYLDQVESPHALRVAGWLGRRIPIKATASGAALMLGGLHVVSDAVERGVIAVACGVPGIQSIDVAVSITAPAARLRGDALARARAAVAETAAGVARVVSAERNQVPAGEGPAPD